MASSARAKSPKTDQESAMPRISALFPVLVAATLVVPTLAEPAIAERVPLSQQTAISDGLIAAAIAYEIGERCANVSTRLVRGLSFLASLRSEARRLGYSAAEIDAYMRDRAEKTRLEAAAWERFAALGGNRADSATFCAVARSQMAAGTQIGQLLR